MIERSSYLSYANVHKAWGDWVKSLDTWQWYVTLTFKPIKDKRLLDSGFNLAGMITARKAWKSFIGEIVQQSGIFYGALSYVRTIEFQKWRGAAHIHALVGETGGDLREFRKWSWEKYGWNKIYAYVPDKGAEHYITKYIVKDLQDIEFGEKTIERAKELNGQMSGD